MKMARIDEHQNRQRQQQQDHGGNDVEDALDQRAQRVLDKAGAIDQPAGLQRVDRHFAADAFVERRYVRDRDAAHATLQQVIHGHRPATLFARGDDDFRHLEALDDRLQLQARRKRRRTTRPAVALLLLGSTGGIETHDDGAPRSLALDDLLDRQGLGSGADDQDASRADTGGDRGHQQRTHENHGGQREQGSVRKHPTRRAALGQHAEKRVADGHAHRQRQHRASHDDAERLVFAGAEQAEHRSDGRRDRGKRDGWKQGRTSTDPVGSELHEHRQQHRTDAESGKQAHVGKRCNRQRAARDTDHSSSFLLPPCAPKRRAGL